MCETEEVIATSQSSRYTISWEVRDRDGSHVYSGTREIPIGILDIDTFQSFWTQLHNNFVEFLTIASDAARDSLRSLHLSALKP